MFLKNQRQRIVQYYIKIEPCHAKVFRPTTVQRHIRDRANADSAVCTPKHQTKLRVPVDGRHRDAGEVVRDEAAGSVVVAVDGAVAAALLVRGAAGE